MTHYHCVFGQLLLTYSALQIANFNILIELSVLPAQQEIVREIDILQSIAVLGYAFFAPIFILSSHTMTYAQAG